MCFLKNRWQIKREKLYTNKTKNTHTMEYYSNISQYKSINSILGSFYSDLFDSITMVMRPIVGGVDYLRYMHRAAVVQRELDKISHWDFEMREKLLDALTDIVSMDAYDEEFANKLETKLSGLDEFSETFKHLEQLTKGLNGQQQYEIIRISLDKLNGRMFSIRNQINSKIWEKKEDINQLLILDQIVYLTQKLIERYLKALRRKKPDAGLLSMIVFTLLKLEAFRRGKITLDDLQNFISELSFLDINEEPILEKYNVVFDTLPA
jgi:hypothetical protein